MNGSDHLKNHLLNRVAEAYNSCDSEAFDYASSIYDEIKYGFSKIEETDYPELKKFPVSPTFKLVTSAIVSQLETTFYRPGVTSPTLKPNAGLEAPKLGLEREKHDVFGYHCPIVDYRHPEKRTGLVATLSGESYPYIVVIERHGVGHISSAITNFSEIAMQVFDKLKNFPEEVRKKPGKDVIFTFTIDRS